MSGYEILEHTADTGFRAWGATRDDLYAAAALALVNIALDASSAAESETRPLQSSGDGEEECLVNWLNEVLWLIDGQRFAPARFSLALDGDLVRAQAAGEPRHDRRHPPRIVVKAATYHQLRITREGDRWEAEVYLDI